MKQLIRKTDFPYQYSQSGQAQQCQSAAFAVLERYPTNRHLPLLAVDQDRYKGADFGSCLGDLSNAANRLV